jgi:alginate O-acetyltransferase complex protein AlgI
VLLVASYGFYATLEAPHLLLVLALVTAVSYGCGLWLGRAPEDQRRRIFWAGASTCVAALVAVRALPSLLAPTAAPVQAYPGLLVSTGVSYFAFQAISYLADVYLGAQEPEEHLGYHALALAFFPRLLQGPIERAGDLLPQLRRPYAFDYDAARQGVLLFSLGLFKKVVLADRLAVFADAAYNDVHGYPGLPLLLATVAYAFQIYFDFSGYTDMARGTARLFGIALTENFDGPYRATSIADFWRRWHISFSRWILDYIFKPLQLAWRHQGRAGTALALIVTFLVSGLWHGATWGFIAWGLLHGLYLAASTFYRPYQKRLHAWLGVGQSRWLRAWQVGVTFTLVCVAWIFFRARSIDDAWFVLTHLGPDVGRLRELLLLEGRRYPAITLGMAVAFLAVIQPALAREMARPGSKTRWPLYYATVMLILVCGIFGKGSFIYGRF